MIEKTYITKTFLPPIEEYTRMLDQIWASKVLTNEGNFCRIFEKTMRIPKSRKYMFSQ